MTSRFQSSGLLLAAAWLWLTFWPLPLLAAAEVEPAGYVLMASGKVVAVETSRQLRPLQRKSPFFPGESLRTGSNGKAQVRFRDGSLISLRANSEIRLDEFRFNEPQRGADKNIFTLISGGFRTITGKIGKGDPDSYQMKSSVASIGVRGTTYEAVLHGGLDVAAWQGTVIVANDHGSIAVGSAGRYNFATVPSGNQEPRGLMTPPAAIGAQQGPSAGELKGETNKGDAEGGEDEPAGAGYVDAVTDLSSAAVLESGAAEAQVITAYEALTATITVPVPPTVVPDYRIAGVTFDRIALSVAGGTGFNTMLAGGKAGYDNNGILRIADNMLDPSQPGFDTTPYVNVLSQGLAQAGVPSSSVIDASSTVTWGVWQGTAATPAYLMTNAADASIYTPIIQPVYWIAASASIAVGVHTGMVEYSNVHGFAGQGSSGPINNVYMNLSVNFDTATTVGEVHIYAPSQYWEIALAGNVSAPTLNFTTVSGTVNGSGTVAGEFYSFFTGNNAQAIVSGFDLALAADPLTHVEGVVLVDNQGLDLRLTAAEAASLDRLGFVAQSNGVAGAGVKFGRAADGASGDPLFSFNTLMPGDPFFSSGLSMELLRRNGALLPQGVATHTLYPVSWGIWDAGALLQSSGFDPAAAQNILVADPMVWMTLAPTLDTALAGRSGSGFYQFNQCCTPGYFALVDGSGQLSATYFDLAIDFDKATFFGGLNLNEADGDFWNLQFKGNVLGARLDLSAPLANTVYYSGGTNYAVDGALAMSLVGATGEALAVLYDLEAAGAPNFYIQGAFVAERDLRLSVTEMSAMSYLAINAGPSWGNLFRMSTAAGAGQTPLFAGDTMYNPNDGAFYLASNGAVWRQGNAVETKLGAYAVMSDPAYEVNWGRWDGGAGAEVVNQFDPANPASQSLYPGIYQWLVFSPTPPAALAAKAGSVTYSTPVAFAGNGVDGQITPGSFTFNATVDFDSGALNSGVIALSHLTGPSWNLNFSAPAGTLGGAGALPYIGANGTYTDPGIPSTVTASGNVALMTTGPNAEALAGGFNFSNSGGSGAKTVEGVFLVCQSGGC